MIRSRSIAILVLILFAGCAQAPPEAKTPSEANRKLIDLCKEDYNLDIVTRAFDHTLWVYLPLEEPFLYMASSAEGPVKSPEPEQQPVIRYLDGRFESGGFHLTYDIGLRKSYTDDKGIKTKYTEAYTKKQQFLIGAVNRAFGDVGDRDGEAPPDFIVLVIADINRGIESRMFLHLKDLQRAMIDQGFGEEYTKRAANEQPIGHDVIVGDRDGSHLNAYDLGWGEFLMKQMVYRTLLKYTHSAFPPSGDTRLELTTIAADTVGAYDFEDFEYLELYDLDAQARFRFTPSDLAAYHAEVNLPGGPSEGRLIHIQFQ